METCLSSGSVWRTGEPTYFLVCRKLHLFVQVKAKCFVIRSRLTGENAISLFIRGETLKSNLTFFRHLTRTELGAVSVAEGQVLPE